MTDIMNYIWTIIVTPFMASNVAMIIIITTLLLLISWSSFLWMNHDEYDPEAGTMPSRQYLTAHLPTPSTPLPRLTRLGLATGKPSLIADEFADDFAEESAEGATGQLFRDSTSKEVQKEEICTVKSLWVYPIKSCRGVELEEAVVERKGLAFDRVFCFAVQRQRQGVRGEGWDFLTQRMHGQLAMVRVDIWLCKEKSRLQEEWGGGVAMITFPLERKSLAGAGSSTGAASTWRKALTGTRSSQTFSLPLNPSDDMIRRKGYREEPLTIFDDTITALNMESEIPHALRVFLGLEHRRLGIFRVRDMHLRPITQTLPLGYQPVAAFQDEVSGARIATALKLIISCSIP